MVVEPQTASSSQIFSFLSSMMRWPLSLKKNLPKKYNISLSLFLLQITFDFTNIGSVLGAAVSLIGSFAIDFGRGLIVDGVKKVLNLNLNTGQVDIDAAGDYGATSEPAVRG